MGTGVSREKLASDVDQLLKDAHDTGLKERQRVARLNKLCRLCQHPDAGKEVQRVVTDQARLESLRQFLNLPTPSLVSAALRVVMHLSNNSSIDFKYLVGRVFMGVLVELMDVEEVPVRALVATCLANLLIEEWNQGQLVSLSGMGFIVESLSSTSMELQLAGTRAVAHLSQNKSLRPAIIEEGGLFPLVSLCFVGNMYGLVRHHALRAVANLTKEELVRQYILAQDLLPRLARLVNKADDRLDPLIKYMVASIYANFSLSEDTSGVASYDAIPALYTLIFSENMDYVVEGLWALANYCKEDLKRQEIIATSGVDYLFKLLKVKEVQVWFEVARCVLNISTGSDDEKEYLIDRGALEAIMGIFSWCMEYKPPDASYTSVSKPGAKKKQSIVGLEAIDLMGNVASVEQSARFMTMTVATHALKNLTALRSACHKLVSMGGDKPLLTLLRMEFNREGQQHAAAVLGNMADDVECARALVSSGIIESLIDLLNPRLALSTAVYQEAAFALANIVRHDSGYEKILNDNNGVTALVGVLLNCNSPVLAYNIFRCLAMLTNEAGVREIAQTEAHRTVVTYANSAEPHLRLVVTKILQRLILLDDDALHLRLAAVGVLQPLVHSLKEDMAEEVRLLAASALAKITTKIDSIKLNLVREEGATTTIITSVDLSTDEEILVSLLTILGNLSALEETRKRVVADASVVERVCNCLPVPSLAGQAMRILTFISAEESMVGAITNEYSVYKFAEMCEQGDTTLQRQSMTVLANLAQFPNNWADLLDADLLGVCKTALEGDNFDFAVQAVRAISNLSTYERALEAMNDSDLIETLATTSKQFAVPGEAERKRQKFVDFTEARTIKMQAQILTALRNLCKTESVMCKIIEELHCLPVFIQLLESDSLDIRKEASACLGEIIVHESQRKRIISLNGREAVMRALKVSVTVVSELERAIDDLQRRVDEDAAGVAQPSQGYSFASRPSMTAETIKRLRSFTRAPANLPIEERERLVVQIEQKSATKRINAELQAELAKIIYYLCEDDRVLQSFITTWDWNIFTGPLSLANKEAQYWGALACFRLASAGKKITKFVESRGVFYVLRALGSEDEQLKHSAARTLGVISACDKFEESVVQEGGVGVLVQLLRSTDAEVIRNAFQAVSLLCANPEIVQTLVAQGMLGYVYEAQKRWGTTQPELMTTIVLIIVNVSSNDHLRWKILDSGGLDLLILNAIHPQVAIAKLVLRALLALSLKGDDVREKISACPMLQNLIDATKSFNPEIVRDSIQIIYNVASKEAYRAPFAKKAVADNLLTLISEDGVADVLSKRRAAAVTANPDILRQPEELESFQPTQTPREAESDPLKPNSMRLLSAGRRLSAARKLNADYPREIAIVAMKTLGSLASVDVVKQAIATNAVAVNYIIGSTRSPNADMKWQAARVLCILCNHGPSVDSLIAMGVLKVVTELCTADNPEIRRLAAGALATLSDQQSCLRQFQSESVLAVVKQLAVGRKELQQSSAQILKNISSQEQLNGLLIGNGFLENLVGFTESDNAQMKHNALIAIRNLIPEIGRLLVQQKVGSVADNVVKMLPRIVATFRSAPRDSPVCAAALEVLAALVLLNPEHFGSLLVEEGVLRDFKSLLISRPRKTVASVRPNEATADIRIPVSQILLPISRIESLCTPMLRTIDRDHFVELIRIEANDCINIDFLVSMVRLIGNCSAIAYHREKLLRHPALKSVLCSLLTFNDVNVIHGAAFALACLSETNAKGITRLAQECPMATLITAAASLVRKIKNAFDASGMTTLRALYEISRVIAAVSESDASGASPDVLQKLKEEVIGPAGAYPFIEIRWQLQAALCRSNHQPPSVSTKYSAPQVDAAISQLVAGDTNWQLSILPIYQLVREARDAPSQQQTVVRDIISRGVVTPLLGFLETEDVPALCSAATWTLTEIAAESSAGRQRIVEEGLNQLISHSGPSDHKRFMHSKILSLCLRDYATIEKLKTLNTEVTLPCFRL
eukprot:TRINITY_DN3684_c0_g1_i1.p1 TRINITY_DN3684_c0_g1~~TRINITY_DN3684_c0_g1_i1.p1  ORF type:complete len:1997 (-),score=387.90 TRINITY_DN3684_c0_g1_i1:41-6031(-)